jgi:hypothetical protein
MGGFRGKKLRSNCARQGNLCDGAYDAVVLIIVWTEQQI